MGIIATEIAQWRPIGGPTTHPVPPAPHKSSINPEPRTFTEARGHAHAPPPPPAAFTPPMAPLSSQGGWVYVTTDDPDKTAHCGYQANVGDYSTACGGLNPQLLTDALYWSKRRMPHRGGFLSVGLDVAQNGMCTQSFRGWYAAAGLTEPVTYIKSASEIAAVNFGLYSVVYVPSSDTRCTDGLTDQSNLALQTRSFIITSFVSDDHGSIIARRFDITSYINDAHGSILVQSQNAQTNPYLFFPGALNYVSNSYEDVNVTPYLGKFCPACTNQTMSRSGVSYHGYFTGPNGWLGLNPLLYKRGQCPNLFGPNQNCQVAALYGFNVKLTNVTCWNGDGSKNEAASDCWKCGDNWVDQTSANMYPEECDNGTMNGVSDATACKKEMGDPQALSTWVTGQDPCLNKWLGVSCSGSQVMGLDFMSIHIPRPSTPTPYLPMAADETDKAALLPVSLGELTSLTALAFGPTAKIWSSPSKLKDLRNGRTNVEGQLPAHWSGMVALTALAVAHNQQLEGTLPPQWSSMTGLRDLDLQDSGLQGTLPPQWSAMTRMGQIVLSTNNLTSSVPPEWGDNSAMDNTELCGIFPTFPVEVRVFYNNTKVSDQCAPPPAPPPGPPPPFPPLAPGTQVPIELFRATVARYIKDGSELPAVKGVEIVVTGRHVSTRFRVPTSSSMSTCGQSSIEAQIFIISTTMGLPTPNISADCSNGDAMDDPNLGAGSVNVPKRKLTSRKILSSRRWTQ
eukprot:gene10000-7884_t